MNKSKTVITIVISITIIALASLGAFMYTNTIEQQRIERQTNQSRKDEIFTKCMERTKTETVGMSGTTWINKDGDAEYCNKQSGR